MSIPEFTKLQLWGRAAGRCQYRGCNKTLWMDSLTKSEFNVAYIAHIFASKQNGPRGDKENSKKLRNDISNLMLLCDEHHRLIDKGDIEGHPVNKLVEMKREHEKRMQWLTSLTENLQSHVLLYGANIGQHSSMISFNKAAIAMLPSRYPAEDKPIEIGMIRSPYRDWQESYWSLERDNLQEKFSQYLEPRISKGEIDHLSIFALAPQPLLIELGHLVSDITAADVYQLHREPPDWKWQQDPDVFEYIVDRPVTYHRNIAINFSLSATIINSRIIKVLGDDTSIWSISIQSPANDFLKSKEQLRLFRQTFRKMLDEIKATHGQDQLLHVFPAVPVAVAVEIGRVWMPKADLPMRIYDENRRADGFAPALDIENG